MTVELAERDFEALPLAKNGRRPVLRPSEGTNLAGVDTGRHTLSHTRISVFLSCHRKFQLEYVERLQTIVRPRYFSLGSAYQKAIEFQDPEVGVRLLNGFEPCETCHGNGYDGTLTTFGESLMTPTCSACNGRGYTGDQVIFHVQELEDRHRVDEAIVRAAAKLYLGKWPSAPAGSIREFEYKLRLRSPWTGAYSTTYDLLGYADELIDPTLGTPGIHAGPLELVENKLVGRIEATQVLSLPLNRQVALERYGIWRATGRPVTRVWYRWMKKPSIKQRGGRKADKSDAETLEQFIDRIGEDYETRPEFYFHEEDPKFVTTEDLLRVEAELWEWAEDFRQRMRNGPDGRRRVFDRDTTRCAEYGGCQFIPICTGDPDAHALYQVRPERAISNESAPEAE